MRYPKIRIYQRYRPRSGGPESWSYICSTTTFASIEMAVAAFSFGMTGRTFTGRMASTHGYYIED